QERTSIPRRDAETQRKAQRRQGRDSQVLSRSTGRVKPAPSSERVPVFSALNSASLRLCGEHTFRMATASLLLAMTAGCGYHVSGHGDMLPKTIHTIAIPAFGNVTSRYKLARLLPTDIGRELLSRTGYRIVAEPNEADAVLMGTVHNFVAY